MGSLTGRLVCARFSGHSACCGICLAGPDDRADYFMLTAVILKPLKVVLNQVAAGRMQLPAFIRKRSGRLVN